MRARPLLTFCMQDESEDVVRSLQQCVDHANVQMSFKCSSCLSILSMFCLHACIDDQAFVMILICVMVPFFVLTILVQHTHLFVVTFVSIHNNGVRLCRSSGVPNRMDLQSSGPGQRSQLLRPGCYGFRTDLVGEWADFVWASCCDLLALWPRGSRFGHQLGGHRKPPFKGLEGCRVLLSPQRDLVPPVLAGTPASSATAWTPRRVRGQRRLARSKQSKQAKQEARPNTATRCVITRFGSYDEDDEARSRLEPT